MEGLSLRSENELFQNNGGRVLLMEEGSLCRQSKCRLLLIARSRVSRPRDVFTIRSLHDLNETPRRAKSNNYARKNARAINIKAANIISFIIVSRLF